MAEKQTEAVKQAARALARLQRFQDNTTKSIGRLTTVATIKTRRQLLDDRWKEYQDAFDELVDGSEEQFDAAETEFEIASGFLQEMLERFAPAVLQPMGGAVAQPLIAQPIRMKAIEVPEFSGDIEDWVSFRDLFSSLVVYNNTVSNVQRLQYLRVACQGKSAELIKNIELTDGNYDVAWAALVRRYENERLLVSRKIERLLDLPCMTAECPAELGQLLDGTNQALAALRVLRQPVEHWDGWIVVHTVRKLDLNTRMMWERSIAATTEMSTYADLDMFLSGVLRSFEAVKGMVASTSHSYNQKRTVRTHVVESRTSGCMMCKGAHALHRCPGMLTMAVPARREYVERNRICFNCLGSKGHASQTCGSRYNCAICNEAHHTLLHMPNTSGEIGRQNPFDVSRQHSAANAGASVSTNVCQSTMTGGVLLPTAWVLLAARNGKMVKVRALIDQASEATLITERAVQKLAATKMTSNTVVKGVGGTSAGVTASSVELAMSSCLEGEKKGVNVTALVMSKVTSRLPSRTIARTRWSHLERLQLADPEFEQPGEIDLLIGANVFSEILMNGVQHGGHDDVVAQQTIFGWIVTGRAMAVPSTTVVTMHVQLDGLLQKFWEQEEVPKKMMMSPEDAACEAMYAATTKRAGDGRYVVDLPFRQGGRELGESQYNAVRRLLQMEKRGEQHPEMYEGYREFMRTYLALNHMEVIPTDELNTVPHCYLPHHAVFKPDSTSTKLRVVFDATAATTNGRGLNALLLTGPRLQETLSSILMRWRRHQIAISADVEKMYRQIWVTPAHQDYQRIVWRETTGEPVQHYRLKTVTYGTASAPYMAVKTMQKLAEDEKDAFPRAAEVVCNDFYVDDCLSGADTLVDAITLKEELLALMQAGGMKLLKWSSNSRDLLRTLPDDHIECRAPLEFDDDDSIKALGIRWYPAADEFRYKVHVPAAKSTTTKREMLSEISRLFDPLGLLSPILITAKIQVQKLWLTGLGWDEDLPDEVSSTWRQLQHELHRVEEVCIPRWCHITAGCVMELHGFSDASQLAFAACVYARVQQEDGSVHVTLLAAKTKVAPIKQQCVPRLELNGAVLLARLVQECRQALRCSEAEVFAWTDSMTVLAWLRKHANVWPTFIANRVSEVQTTMDATQWQHVPGVDNPADVASRGIMPSEIRTHPLWWTGPPWLKGERDGWPKQAPLVVNEELLETKKGVSCFVAHVRTMPELATRYSSWRRLLRVTAYLLRVLPRNRRTGRPLHADELENARQCWVRIAQANEFDDVAQTIDDSASLRRHKLTKLNPFVDENGVMRVGGRLKNANVAYEERHPAILPTKNAITELIVWDAHERAFHAGPQNTMGRLHQRYWVLCERRRVRQLLHKCVTCARARPLVRHQMMGDLPASRVQPVRAFLRTAIDYAGPIWSRTSRGRGNKAHKSWVAVFVCFSTKAVHLELVSELSTAAFLAAYRRFAARRGVCADIYCDNGTNFVGADREMATQLRAAMQDDLWRAELSDSGTRFHFAPPGSPHFNGLAEAAVKMAKSAMRKTIGETKLTFEEMTTFLAQVEAALNSRPICALPADGDDEGILTPGHFLIGQSITAVPEPNVGEAKTPTNRWHMLQHMVQHFWRRWGREYLHQLQQRSKWMQPTTDIQVGDIVLVHDEMLHSTRWKMGRVIDVHPGTDGRVRVASVKTANGILKRAVVKLSLLPVNNDKM